MVLRPNSLLALLPLICVACGGTETHEVALTPIGNNGVLTAVIRVGDAYSVNFVADEVEASIGPSGRGRELVIYARSFDMNETLALVIQLNAVALPGPIDLANHAVLYHEPGSSGGALFFDGIPTGALELDSAPVSGSSISGRFEFSVPGYDTVHPIEEISATVEGSFLLPVVAHPR